MITFVLAHAGGFANLKVTTHSSREAADHYASSHLPAIVVDSEQDLVQVPGPRLAVIMNQLTPEKPVKRFATAKDGARRVLKALDQKHNTQTTEAAPPAAAAEETSSAGTTETQETTVKTKTKAKKAKKTPAKKATVKKTAAKKNGNGQRRVGKPAGKVADFVPVRAGTTRAKILKEMDGSKNAAAIGKKLDIPASLVSSNVFCLNRDCAIGYKYGENGELTALFPTGKKLEDAIVKAKSAS